MSFSQRELDLIDGTEEVEIETQAPEGPVHRTVVWAIVDDGQVFVRTVRGEKSRWYREAQANPAVALYVGSERLSATAIPATDPDAIERTSDGYRRKYSGDPAMRSMLRPHVLGTTLRIEPT
jgi:hypothetical protein